MPMPRSWRRTSSHRHRRSWPSLPALACAQAESGTFYANRGTRIYADARPPTHWDAASGSNILCKARLPNWSNGSPLLVTAIAGSKTGARLYVLSEPLDYACILSCYDADTGRELWTRDLDPVHPSKGMPLSWAADTFGFYVFR